MVAIKDVAKLAGVSKATVSRVLTGSALVNEELRNRVLKAINELDFRPNINARGLASKRTFAIGIFLPFMVLHFFAGNYSACLHVA
ncbi:MAG: HTH-type transcriptional regulator MalR [Firmicutes bacterium]|nr:HTH-type transcriptional regulator MalR [Bacillota bacterium]